jgi:hypothetical protein
MVGAFGIDNLNNDHYWNFPSLPQRSYRAELKLRPMTTIPRSSNDRRLRPCSSPQRCRRAAPSSQLGAITISIRMRARTVPASRPAARS